MATVKESGGDYATLNAAFAAAETTISIEGTWSSADTTKATCSTASTTVTVDASSKHPGYVTNTNHYRLEGSSGHCITVSADNLDITGIVVKQAGTGSSDECVRINGNYTFTATDCIFYGNSADQNDQDGIYTYQRTCTLNIESCIIFNLGRVGIHDQSQNFNGTRTINVNSCTIANCGRNADNSSGGIAIDNQNATSGITFNIHNTIVMDCSDGTASDYASTGTQHTAPVWNISYSIDSDNSISSRIDAGTGNLASRTQTDNASPGAGDWVIFNDYTTYPYDLCLQDNATDNDAQDMHSTATAHGLTIPSVDIVGTSRPQNTNYDCGIFEVVAAGAATSLVPPSRARAFANLLNH